MAVPPGPPAPLDMNKAVAAGGTAFLGGAIARIVTRIVDAKWPGVIDAQTTSDIGSLVVAILTFVVTYLVPHRS